MISFFFLLSVNDQIKTNDDEPIIIIIIIITGNDNGTRMEGKEGNGSPLRQSK